MADNYLERRYDEVCRGKSQAPVPHKPSLDRLLRGNVECNRFDNAYSVHILQMNAILSVKEHIHCLRASSAIVASPYLGSLQEAIPSVFPDGYAPEAFAVVGSEGGADPNLDMALGALAQTMLLKAVELGLAGAVVLDFDADKVAAKTGVDFKPLVLLAFGKPLV